jgi:hypothetical protein
MSDAPQGPGWWLASDGRWYPPEAVPGPAPMPPAEAGGVGWAAPTTPSGPAPESGPAPWASPSGPGPAPGAPPWASPHGPGPAPGAPPWASPSAPLPPGQVPPSGPPPAWGAPGGAPYPVAAPKPSNGLGIASLVLGIIGCLSFWFFVGGVLGIIGLILGIAGIRKAGRIDNGKGISIAGTILSAFAIAGAILMAVLVAWVIDNADELFDEADPSTYTITTESCSVADGRAIAFGTITNETNKDRRFLVIVDLSTDGTTTSSSTLVPLDPNEESTWTVSTETSSTEVTCSTPTVRRGLQRG